MIEKILVRQSQLEQSNRVLTARIKKVNSDLRMIQKHLDQHSYIKRKSGKWIKSQFFYMPEEDSNDLLEVEEPQGLLDVGEAPEIRRPA